MLLNGIFIIMARIDRRCVELAFHSNVIYVTSSAVILYNGVLLSRNEILNWYYYAREWNYRK